jgi:hypothetical protein
MEEKKALLKKILPSYFFNQKQEKTGKRVIPKSISVIGSRIYFTFLKDKHVSECRLFVW